VQNEYSISIPAEPPNLPMKAFRDAAELHNKLAMIRELVGSLQSEVETLEMINLPEIDEDFDFYREVARYEKKLIQKALRMCGGSQIKASRLLKLKPTTLNSKMKALKLIPK
jgi:Response regulator containing CheY-like receiver, AAA-type ATPase, and DNA-binding domains